MSSWLQFDNILLNRYVLAICDLFPSLSSIDELFFLASEEKLDDLTDFRHLQRYSKVVSILTTSGGKSALLRKGKEKGLAVAAGLEGGSSSFQCGMLLSESECSLV